MEIVEKLRATEMRETGQVHGGIPITKLTQINPDGPEAADEIERLRNVVALLIEYEEHDENILKGAVMWEALIEAAHRALMEKE